MPLTDDKWSRGKCGFKLIQYMACRLPVIASPVGANSIIVENGVTGLLASEMDQWIDSIYFMYDNRDKAKEMGMKGYDKFLREYSFESVSQKYINLLLKESI